MIYTKSGGGAGPVVGYIACGDASFNFLKIFSYRKNTLVPRSLTSQPSGSAPQTYSVGWSENGNFLAVATNDTSAVKLYSRSGETFTSIAVPSNVAGQNGRSAISNDGTFIAATWPQSPTNSSISEARIWHNNAGTLGSINSIGSVSAGSGSCAVSSSGQYIAFLAQSSPYLRIKIRSGVGNSASFSDMTLAAQPTSGSAGGVAFSPDNAFLAVCPANQNHATVYKFNSLTSVYEQLAAPFVGALPDGFVAACSFNAQGDFLAIATSNKTFFYERINDTFTSVANVSGGGAGNFHPSGNFYITGNSQIYRKVSASSWTALGSTLQAGSDACAFSPYI